MCFPLPFATFYQQKWNNLGQALQLLSCLAWRIECWHISNYLSCIVKRITSSQGLPAHKCWSSATRKTNFAFQCHSFWKEPLLWNRKTSACSSPMSQCSCPCRPRPPCRRGWSRCSPPPQRHSFPNLSSVVPGSQTNQQSRPPSSLSLMAGGQQKKGKKKSRFKISRHPRKRRDSFARWCFSTSPVSSPPLFHSNQSWQNTQRCFHGFGTHLVKFETTFKVSVHVVDRLYGKAIRWPVRTDCDGGEVQLGKRNPVYGVRRGVFLPCAGGKTYFFKSEVPNQVKNYFSKF